jgi:hypothetical protein
MWEDKSQQINPSFSYIKAQRKVDNLIFIELGMRERDREREQMGSESKSHLSV